MDLNPTLRFVFVFRFCVFVLWFGSAVLVPLAHADQSSRLSFHGYLTQAWAESSDEEILGIPTDGTFDYRIMALQCRYAMSDEGEFVVQFSHEGLGDDPLGDLRSDVELDWAFYRHKVGKESALQVGRSPIPWGIYNEIRDVGVVLPFYRPHDSVYGDGSFSTETLDGVIFSHTAYPGNGWTLDLDLYVGEWDLIDLTLQEGKAREVIGGQFWLTTPLEGLRLGFGARNYEVESPGQPKDNFDQWIASLEGRRGPATFRAEWTEGRFTGVSYEAWYAELTVEATERLSLHAGVQFADLELPVGPATADVEINDETIVGIGWAWTPQALIKLETHWVEGNPLRPSPTGAIIAPIDTHYTILSFSTGF